MRLCKDCRWAKNTASDEDSEIIDFIERAFEEDFPPEGSDMKLCKDCRWAKDTFPQAKLPHEFDWLCTHPTSVYRSRPNYVLGSCSEPGQMRCYVARVTAADQKCGPEARYWEPADP
jgi:hypothetical protein